MMDYSTKGVFCHIEGDDIYHTLWMPVVPRKGDVLWLSSLTRGVSKEPEVLVSRVAWSMNQRSGLISAWIRVRRTIKVTDHG